MGKQNLKITAGYILICLIWGSTWLAISLGLGSLTPLISAGIRFVLASVFIYMLMSFKKIKPQTDPLSLKLYLVLSLFSYAVPYWLVYWAEQFVPSGLTSIIFSVMPFFVIIFSHLFLKSEPITVFQIVGAIIGFGGIVVIFAENLSLDLTHNAIGILAVLLSAMMQAGIGVTMKKYGKNLNPLSMNFFPMLSAGALLICAAYVFENPNSWIFDHKAILSIIYLALIGTALSFTTYYWLLKRINVVALSLSSFITPIIAVFLGWFILNENFSFQTVTGSIFVLIGILFANFRGLKNYYFSKTAIEK